LDSSQVDAIHYVIPSLAYVDFAWAEGDAALAQQHAERAFSLALKSGSPYLRVYAQACRGLAHMITGRLGSAIEDLSAALDFARTRRAGLENEPRILADLANAYRQSGDTVAAFAAVDEAIAVATERHARVPECFARLVRADLLLRSKAGDRTEEGREELERAKALVRETGAAIFETFINATGQTMDSRQTSTGAK